MAINPGRRKDVLNNVSERSLVFRAGAAKGHRLLTNHGLLYYNPRFDQAHSFYGKSFFKHAIATLGAAGENAGPVQLYSPVHRQTMRQAPC